AGRCRTPASLRHREEPDLWNGLRVRKLAALYCRKAVGARHRSAGIHVEDGDGWAVRVGEWAAIRTPAGEGDSLGWEVLFGAEVGHNQACLIGRAIVASKGDFGSCRTRR